MNQAVIERLRGELSGLREQGLYKSERVLAGPQGGVVRAGARDVINLCANNYLGLAIHAVVRAAAQRAIDEYGYGMASVRFICGTQVTHKALEQRLARFLGTEDVILYSSCFDANGGLFETLLDERDAVISDALNHASIIDGIRLCKAQRHRYANSDMAELERCLRQAQGARTRLIATDGVFSMDGFIAKLGEICELAARYDALVMVDDSHATGFMGATGRGTPEHCGVAARVDILTGTLGKALGGGSGGYVAARREVIEWLRQRSRPHLFSNSIPAGGGPRQPRGARAAGTHTAAARTAVREHAPVPRRAHPGRLRPQARRASDHPGHARGCGARRPHGRPAAGARRVRHRLLLSGRAQRAGAHPHPDVRGADTRAARARRGRLHQRGPRARRAQLKRRLQPPQEKRIMKALVKQRAAPGIWLEDIPEA